VQRLQTRAQYDAAMAGGTVSRTVHFVLHRAALDAAPSRPAGPAADTGRTSPPLFPVPAPWIGAVVPKRWAKRAVTRNGIKRQVYNVSASFEATLPQAAHVVRLRTAFDRDLFKSAWSDALKAAVRGELLQLFEKAKPVRDGAKPPPEAPRPAP
jgi:ribonuclease P protein component